jgi:hypothetical protein
MQAGSGGTIGMESVIDVPRLLIAARVFTMHPIVRRPNCSGQEAAASFLAVSSALS